MSIVCCRVTDDKIEIASDSISIRGYTQSKGDKVKYSKLVKVNEMIIGGVGFSEENFLMQLFAQTHNIKDANTDAVLTFLAEFSDWKKKKIDNYKIENNFIFLYKSKAFYIERFLIQEVINYQAIGAGDDFALSALYLGHSVEKAVETACELSIYCEKPIIKYEMKINK